LCRPCFVEKYNAAKATPPPARCITVAMLVSPRREAAMAQRTIVELIDDLDGKPIKAGTGETVTFGLEKAEYQIDLSKANAGKLRKALEPYVSAARTVGGRKRGRRGGGRSQRRRDYDIAALRAWAASNRIDVPPHGRIPREIVEKFKAAMG